MLTGCNSAFSTLLLLLPAAATTTTTSNPPQFRRDGPPASLTRNLRNPRSLRSGGSASHWRCAASAQPPPPPPPPPPEFGGGDGSSSSGSLSRFQEELSKIQDRVRIFFAVLFWMSLFFWASAWDGSDDPRNKKGPRFGKRFK